MALAPPSDLPKGINTLSINDTIESNWDHLTKTAISAFRKQVAVGNEEGFWKGRTIGVLKSLAFTPIYAFSGGLSTVRLACEVAILPFDAISALFGAIAREDNAGFQTLGHRGVLIIRDGVAIPMNLSAPVLALMGIISPTYSNATLDFVSHWTYAFDGKLGEEKILL